MKKIMIDGHEYVSRAVADKLAEVLQFYADKDRYRGHIGEDGYGIYADVAQDEGSKAKAALAEYEDAFEQNVMGERG